MSGGKVLALFDVDGTLTKPRNVSARPQAWDILMSRCQSVPLCVCVRARLCVSLRVSVRQPDLLVAGATGSDGGDEGLHGAAAREGLSLSLALARARARARRRACSLYPTL